MPILSSFGSEFQKCYLFLRTAIKNAKNCISKSDVITYTWFFDHCTAKFENIALKFGMCDVCMYLYNIYSGLYERIAKRGATFLNSGQISV